MTVDSDKAAAQITYEGRTYYFCSEACERRFEAQPDRYAPFAGEPLADSAEAAPLLGSEGSGGAEYDRPSDTRNDREAR